LSGDFYHCYRAGELEQTRDFIRWSGYYEAKQERERQYRQLAYEHLRELRPAVGSRRISSRPGGRMSAPLEDIASYSEFVYALGERHPHVTGSTLTLAPIGATLAKLEGRVFRER
jgi:hypothetical protein